LILARVFSIVEYANTEGDRRGSASLEFVLSRRADRHYAILLFGFGTRRALENLGINACSSIFRARRPKF